MASFVFLSDDTRYVEQFNALFQLQNSLSIFPISAYNDFLIWLKNHNPLITFIVLNSENSNAVTLISKHLPNYHNTYIVYLIHPEVYAQLKTSPLHRPLMILNQDISDPFTVLNITNILSKINPQDDDWFSQKFIELHDKIPYSIRQVLRYIESHLEEKITVDDLALIAKCNKFHLNRLFLHYLKVTPYHYVLHQKIELAKVKLIQTEIPIHQIAQQLQFNSHASFSKTFKRIVLLSPEKFRTLYK